MLARDASPKLVSTVKRWSLLGVTTELEKKRLRIWLKEVRLIFILVFCVWFSSLTFVCFALGIQLLGVELLGLPLSFAFEFSFGLNFLFIFWCLVLDLAFVFSYGY